MKWPWSHEPEAFETLIAAGAEFKGPVVARGPVHIHGRVEGNVRGEDLLVIGPGGEVRGDVWGRVVTIGGRVDGRVEATERAEILATGRLCGDIYSPAVSIEVGAVFEGASHMGSPPGATRQPQGRRGDRPGSAGGPTESVA